MLRTAAAAAARATIAATMPADRRPTATAAADAAGVGEAVWVVLPTYDEVDNLGAVVRRLREALASAGVSRHFILIVDDASPDGTGLLADRIAAEHREVVVLHRPVKRGIGGAYAAGFDRALREGADLVVQMDADASHDPVDVPRLIAACRDGADVVVGSRYVTGGGIAGWSAGRRALSRFGSWYARRALSVEVRDLTGGFKCFTRPALGRIDPGAVRARGYAFQVETTYRAIVAGLTVVEIPIVFTERRRGTSKMTAAIALEAAWAVPRLRRRLRRDVDSRPAGGSRRQRSDKGEGRPPLPG